jgi:hypothetical protein
MVDTVPEDFKRRSFRQDLPRSALAGETALSPDFLHADTTSGGLPQSPRTVQAPR